MLQLTPREGANVEPWPTSANLITPTHSTVWASHNGCRPDTIAMRLQLTPREGGEPLNSSLLLSSIWLQLTPRVGANLTYLRNKGEIMRFNSRPRVVANL